MQAILTKSLAAARLGFRIKATCARGSLTIDRPDNMDARESHIFAARIMADRFALSDQQEYGTPLAKNPWSRKLVSGCLPSGDWAHVFAE